MDETKVKLSFATIDYILFATMMGLSFLIGVYYGFIRKEKQNSAAEYLLGSKKMKVWPTAISLTATHVSAGTIIGVPAEMYKHGIQYWACAISGLVVTVATVYIFLPVFHDLGSASCYAYLEKRYSPKIRQIASFLFFILVLTFSPLLVYTPSLAFSQVSGISLHYITPVLTFVCVFYTTFGGLRAVVWTDTLQFSAMVLAIIVVMIRGTNEVGGVANVFKVAEEGGRLIWFDFDFDPFVRSTFWMVSVGLTSMWVAGVGVSPECVQRFVAIPKKSDAVKAAWIFGIGHIFIKLFAVYNGLLIFAKYSMQKCDPIFNGDVEKYDQIFPYFVMDVSRNIPGLSGLFIVGALSASLSSLSSGLNSLSGTVYEDFIRPFYPKSSERMTSTIMKVLTFGIGCICFVLVFVVEKLGGVFSIGIAIGSMSTGTLLGLFTMGMLSKNFNTKGAWWGSVVSIAVVLFIIVGAQINIFAGNLLYETLPFNIENCDATSIVAGISPANSTIYIQNAGFDNSSVHWIFRINYMYYSLIGTILTVVVGYPISLMTGGTEDLDPRLLAPFVRGFYATNLKKSLTELTFVATPEETEKLKEKCQD